MAAVARVLLIGNDRSHLFARAEVLQHFWVVETAALDHGETPTYDAEVAVICLTVKEDERQEWVERARQSVPLIIIVRVDGFVAGPLAGADATVEDEHGPGALVSTIYQLLTERGLPSHGWDEPKGPVWVQ